MSIPRKGISTDNITIPIRNGFKAITINNTVRGSNRYVAIKKELINIFEKEYGNNNVANLHDYEKYNYKREDIIGLKKWYTVYIQNSIKNSKGEKVGLSQEIHLEKPIHESNFKYSYKIEEFKQPQNIIEDIIELFNNIINKVKYIVQEEGL